MPKTHAELMQKLYGCDAWAYAATKPDDLQGWNGATPELRSMAGTEITDGMVVLDVGVWKGQSTITLAETVRRFHVDGCVIAIDTFLGSHEHWTGELGGFSRRMGIPDLYETFLSNVAHRGLQDYVIPLPQTSAAAAVILANVGVSASLVHIDASHDYEDVIRDARAYWKLIKPGGALVGDDYHHTWPGVMKAADEFAAEVGLTLEDQCPKWIVRKLVGHAFLAPRPRGAVVVDLVR